MSQNSNNHPHGSPPNLPPQGFEDLMGSLKSPGLVAPMAPFQQGFAQWPMQWQQNAAHGNFPFGVSHQMSPPNQMAWAQNTQNGYGQLDQEDDDDLFTVDDTDILSRNGRQHSSSTGRVSGQMTQGPNNQQNPPPGQFSNLASSSPLSLPPPQFSEGQTPGSTSALKPSMVSTPNTTARAAELRAQLLAAKTSKSRQASPAVKTNELNNAKKTLLPGTLKKQTNGDLSVSKEQAVPASAQTGEKAATQVPERSAATATSLDNLMAEARNAADAQRNEAPLANGKISEGAHDERQAYITTNGTHQTGTVNREQHSIRTKSRSPSELSEPGEIRSNAGTPSPAEQPEPPKTTEPSRVVQQNQDKQEKLARQSEVKKAYQPLKKPTPKKSEPKAAQAKSFLPAKPTPVPQQSRKPSFERRQSAYERPEIREEPRRDQDRERARDYDRWNDDPDLRRPSLSQAYPNPSDLERDVAARRQKLTEDNSRRAAEYKRKLDSQRAQGRQADSISSRLPQEASRQETGANGPPKEPSTSVPQKSSMMSNGPANVGAQANEPGNIDQDVDMISPREQTNGREDDVNDWLEMTEFYDEEYRERRLKLFRKKKALDIQRAELELEEEHELQQRTQRNRAQSVLSNNTPSSTVHRPPTANVRMPPPPLPLPFREANKDTGMRIKDAALSAGLSASQTSSPKLKRQHAEDNTEPSRTNSIDKRARLDISGPSSDERPLTSPSSAKGERPQFIREAPTLGSRISRYDSWAPRPRSRSPDYRRRSLSPRGRRDYSPLPPPPGGYRPRDFSAGPRRFEDHIPHTCFNCGQRGHKHSQCQEPRRDGRDLPLSRGREQWVSPNYRGNKPVTKPPKSRLSSITKAEEGYDVGGGPASGGPSR